MKNRLFPAILTLVILLVQAVLQTGIQSVMQTGLRIMPAAHAQNVLQDLAGDNELRAGEDELRVVAWNIEHLAEANGEGCVPRTDEDYRKLREFANSMDADVVALQEVESVNAMARVFPAENWTFVISERPPSEPYTCRGNGNPSTQQKVGFAIRKGVGYERKDDFRELGLGLEGLRYGVVIQLTDFPEPMHVMAVHLKSGCFVDDYAASDRRACETFEQQAPLLDRWVEENFEQNQGFIVLGDFNHRISNTENRLWKLLTDMDEQPVMVMNSMSSLKGCHPRYPEPIDHILFGAGAERYYQPGSEMVHYFGDSPETMTEEQMLSDHCPISIGFRF